MKINLDIKGLWFFGLSGSGKTYLSKKISKYIKNSFIIDGDIVRSLIGFDLGYTLKDRKKSNKISLGLSKLVILNNQFPIVSSVYLDPKISKLAKKYKIKVINVVFNNRKIVNSKLKKKKNVVGKSIKQPKINCETLKNKPNIKINIKKLCQKM
tara:strand:+ start:96 stop:557 length:462 start_codon:yes stop_codon:yes gene_type:complete